MYAKWQLFIHVSHIRPMKKGSCSNDFIDTEVKIETSSFQEIPCRSKIKINCSDRLFCEEDCGKLNKLVKPEDTTTKGEKSSIPIANSKKHYTICEFMFVFHCTQIIEYLKLF